MSFLPILVIGFTVGLLLGLTGIGSGSVLTPLLILFGGLSPATAVGTSLVFAFATKMVGSWRFYARGFVDMPVIRKLMIGAVPGLLLGILLVLRFRRLSAHVESIVLTRAIGAALVCVAALILASFLPSTETHPFVRRLTAFCTAHDRPLVLCVGFAVALAVTVTSIGAGAALVPALYVIYRRDSGMLVGTSIFFGTILSAAGGILHAGSGDLKLAVVGVLLLGSLPGIWLSSHVHGRVPRRASERIIAAALLVLGLRFLFY